MNENSSTTSGLEAIVQAIRSEGARHLATLEAALSEARTGRAWIDDFRRAEDARRIYPRASEDPDGARSFHHPSVG